MYSLCLHLFALFWLLLSLGVIPKQKNERNDVNSGDPITFKIIENDPIVPYWYKGIGDSLNRWIPLILRSLAVISSIFNIFLSKFSDRKKFCSLMVLWFKDWRKSHAERIPGDVEIGIFGASRFGEALSKWNGRSRSSRVSAGNVQIWLKAVKIYFKS